MTIESWKQFQESDKPADIFRQLQDLGYKLTQRTFYRHCEKGKCRMNEEGMYSRRMVKQYIEAEGIQREGETVESDDGPSPALSVEKQRLENEKLQLANGIAELNYKKKQGQLLERDALYLELAARTVAFENGMKQKLDLECPSLITVVNGEVSRLPEFQDMLFQVIDDALNDFARTDEFEVLFEEEEG